ncbi:MAG: cell cycle protein [Sphingobacteriales bacterium SCN 48-20]|jgi:rod shape determining protein RodA|uniref:rod shape-determining protein RodA n=1 Tax=Terrimonas ferruginea TaxID=249 RepID=UPI000868BC39|nr:rod shape-determining protein RodA [Terrimonas ferruginea]MBN8784436.1 rod shape-determining protein RodA [Terrimonas ferruginea]ODT90570.1 MAG: cell cycle protein [Sphingobacteriales bacterium SCN 48-20]OJW40465.1 MAG: cell cycle protein [Sphingobacteriales bacterium 48-107]
MSQRNPTISKGMDWSLFGIYILLVAVGLAAIFSVTYKEGTPVVQSFLSFGTDYSKQFYFFLVSLVLGLFILLTDSKFFTATANLFYAGGILALLLVFPLHSNVKGTESIIKLGAFNFQPAEFCKICVALALAKYLSRPETDFRQTRSQLIAAAITLVPAVLAILQKETGLALVFFAFFLVMFREGLPSIILVIGFTGAALVIATLLLERSLLAMILIGITLFIALLLRRQIRRDKILLLRLLLIGGLCIGIQYFAVPFFFKNVLGAHQVERIYSTLGKDIPEEYQKREVVIDKKSGKQENLADYNVKQSKIAIGSGGVFGKGLLKGTQTRYGFVPEQRTDFIFDTIGEGFGFTGCVVLLALYLLLLFRIVTIAERQRSVFSRCYAYGVASVLFFHVAINVSMTIGLAPVIGIPLPLISYGGASLLTFSLMLFILMRLDADRQMVLR